MVTKQQILRLRQALQKGMSLSLAAAKAGIDRKTARTYQQLDRLPSEVSMEHTWRTREDPFEGVWTWVVDQLTVNAGLQAKTLFEALQAQHPNRFPNSQLRTLQRRIKQWRAEHGPAKEVFFAQEHHPGRLAASDFTHCTDLSVTINGIPFDHMIYHFVLFVLPPGGRRGRSVSRRAWRASARACRTPCGSWEECRNCTAPTG